ncbi:MAG: protease inhibitor I42 family protein [Victivallaceae bacterium]|nr:protease inhibitor I42 family protein [Victivallaceae bacterium]
MKKLFGSLATIVLAAGSLLGETLVNDSFYDIDKLPAELFAVVKPGKDIEFSIEENATTGYVWSAVYDSRKCKVELDHKGPRKSQSRLAGAPGRVEVEIKPLTDAPAVVTLNYSRPFEPEAAPAASVRCIVSTPAAVRTARAAEADKARPVEKSPRPTTARLQNDATYEFATLPPELTAQLPVGREIEFELVEPDNGDNWQLVNYNSTMCRVEFKKESGIWFWKSARVEVEVKGIRPGRTVIEFAAGERTLRCNLLFN